MAHFNIPLPDKRPKQQKQREAPSGLREFIISKNSTYKVVILNPEEAGIESFHVLPRHFVYTPDGKFSKMVCQRLAFDNECLACNGVSSGKLKTGNWPEEPLYNPALPIYDKTIYRKQFVPERNKELYMALDPTTTYFPQEGDIVGGFKVWWTTDSQFRTIRQENENVANICADCNSPMLKIGLECPECQYDAYDESSLSMLRQEDYEKLIYSPHKCDVCGENVMYQIKRACKKCGGTKPKLLYDYVLRVQRRVQRTQNNRERSTYIINVDFADETEVPDVPNWFWSEYAKLNKPLTLQEQQQLLGIGAPQEWLQKERSRFASPYEGR